MGNVIFFILISLFACASAPRADNQIKGTTAGIEQVKPTFRNANNQYNLYKITNIKQVNPTFDIKLWLDKKTYKPGDTINFSFTTARDCYLTMIDISTDGSIRVLFPNKHALNNFVHANTPYNIPEDYGFSMHVTGPAGIERIKIIATTKPMDIFNIDISNIDQFFFESNLESDVVTRGIGGLESKLKTHTWAETELEFDITSTNKTNQLRNTRNAGFMRGLMENEGLPAPKPTPMTGTVQRIRGLMENEGLPAPKPTPMTGTVQHR